MSDNSEKIISMEEVPDSPVDTSPKPNPSADSNKNGGLNALLFIGSFLIVVGACSLLGSAVENIVKLYIILFMVVVFYIAGLLIRKIKILVPAGTAFTCTALAVMPFLGFVFSQFPGVSDELSWFLTSLVGTTAYIYTAYNFRSRLITFFSFGFVISLFCSVPTNLHMATLWNFLSVISVSIIANLISVLAKDRIPKSFRDILTHTARWLSVVVALATIFNTFSLSGYDYSIIFAICLVQFVLSYITSKDYTDEVLARLIAVPLILSLFWNTFPAVSSEYALIAGLVCISQILYSLFSSFLRAEKREREIPYIIVFLFFSLFCPLFAVAKDATISPNIIAIMITSVDLILTIVLSLTWKTNAWLFATYPLAMLLPLFIDIPINKAEAVLIIYAFEMIALSAFHYFQKELSRGLELFNLISFSFVIAMARLGISSGTGESMLAKAIIMNMIAFVVPAFCWLVFGLKDESKNKIEVSLYLFLFCIFETCKVIVSQTASSDTYRINAFMFMTIFVIAMFTMANFRKSRPRAIIGTSIFTYFSLMMILSSNHNPTPRPFSGAIDSGVRVDYVMNLLTLLEEIAIVIYASVKKDKAVFWISASGIILMAFSLTSSATYVWFILAGLAIIGFVIWRLVKTGQKQDSLPKETSSEDKKEDGAPEPPKN